MGTDISQKKTKKILKPVIRVHPCNPWFFFLTTDNTDGHG